MRKKIHHQLPLMPALIDHEHADEVLAMSQVLDGIPDELLERVTAELVRGDSKRGREGMTANSVIRCAVVKHMRGFSYEQLAFHLADSATYRTFCRFGIVDSVPKKSTLQENIKRLSSDTWESINRWILGMSKDEGVEKAHKVRIDSTVTDTKIRRPVDNGLLWDTVRVLCRLMKKHGCAYTDHSKRAKRRHIEITHTKDKDKRSSSYRDLLKVTKKVMNAARNAASQLREAGAEATAEKIEHYLELGRRVVSQTERRVIHGESVPAREKVVSLFEPHTDIIIKDRRSIQYGHKVNLTIGASGMVLDIVVEDGNPADATRAVPMVDRLEDIYGAVPRQAAFDGGYASKANLKALKEKGVKDVAFSKKCGLAVADMVKSSWVYRQLKRFRAGAEAVISFVKRCFGLDQCTWSGLRSFKSYVWGGVVSANLLLFARHRLAAAPEA